MTGQVGYEPVSVKRLLTDMKDTAELMIDLSYSSVLLGDSGVAREVLELEARMDVLRLKARMGLLMAARKPEEAESLAPVLGIVGATEEIADAAGDIAKVVLEAVGLPDAMATTLPEAIETIARAEISADSAFVDRTLGDLALETETGVRAIGIRREGDWVLDPTRESRLSAGDVVLFRGDEDDVSGVFQRASGERYEPPAAPEPEIGDLERAVDSVVLMKNMSELAVDLAYGSVLYNSEPVASEVVKLEAEVDALQSRFEAWVLRAAARVEDPVSLRGLVHLAESTEEISDAAVEISDGVLRGLAGHPVITEAVQDAEETIVRETVEENSVLDGTTLGEARVRTETGMRVIAVRHTEEDPDADRSDVADDADRSVTERSATEQSVTDGHVTDQSVTDGTVVDRSIPEGPIVDSYDRWEVSPGPNTRLRAGSVVLAKGSQSASERLRALLTEPYS